MHVVVLDTEPHHGSREHRPTGDEPRKALALGSGLQLRVAPSQMAHTKTLTTPRIDGGGAAR